MTGTMSTAKPKANRKALRLKTPGIAPASGLRSPLKRISILPQSNEKLWVAPGKLCTEPAKYDLFHNPANRLPFTPLSQIPEASQRETLSVELPSSTTTVKASSSLPVITKPGCHAQKLHRKSIARPKIKWDPAIISTVPIATENSTKLNKSITVADIEPKVLAIEEPIRQTEKGPSEIAEAINAIKQWTKDDTAKLKKVVQALSDLGFDDEERKAKLNPPKPMEEIGVAIATVKSLDPRVPEFESSACLKKAVCPNQLAHEYSTPNEERLDTTLKENVPIRQSTTILSKHQATLPKRTICDDYHEHGRTVAAFDHWYAEKQLIEFMKKYPMTGKRAPAVKKQVKDKRNPHEMVKTGVTSGRHAAMIQQRLEFLLWKAKEKEAMKVLGTQSGFHRNY